MNEAIVREIRNVGAFSLGAVGSKPLDLESIKLPEFRQLTDIERYGMLGKGESIDVLKNLDRVANSFTGNKNSVEFLKFELAQKSIIDNLPLESIFSKSLEVKQFGLIGKGEPLLKNFLTDLNIESFIASNNSKLVDSTSIFRKSIFSNCFKNKLTS